MQLQMQHRAVLPDKCRYSCNVKKPLHQRFKCICQKHNKFRQWQLFVAIRVIGMCTGIRLVVHLQAYPSPTSIFSHAEITNTFLYARNSVSSVVSVFVSITCINVIVTITNMPATVIRVAVLLPSVLLTQ